MNSERYIGTYEGTHGPLVIVIAGMHGNELAGIKALDLLFKMLAQEPLSNPSFQFKGRIIGLYGNIAAIQANKRFIDTDLNRQWEPKHVEAILQAPKDTLQSEEKEVLALFETIGQEIEQYQPNKVILLDLHTTSADDGIFSIPTDSLESFNLAKGLFAPVITKLTETLSGTIMQFFDGDNFGVPTVACSFESGQHLDELSINRSVAAIVNCLRFVGMVQPEDVESKHDEILRTNTLHLPKLARMAYKHPFDLKDKFKMVAGFRNFSPIKVGDYLADDIHGKIVSPLNGFILMPLYQVQGNEGFFIVVE